VNGISTAIGKLYHLRLQVECTLFCNLQSRVRTHAVLVIGLYELLGNLEALEFVFGQTVDKMYVFNKIFKKHIHTVFSSTSLIILQAYHQYGVGSYPAL
jgi:hypothetical protein